MPRYKAEWKPGSRNDEFWEEVLLGRKIVSVMFDNKGISELMLDSGERIQVLGEDRGRLGIVDATNDREETVEDHYREAVYREVALLLERLENDVVTPVHDKLIGVVFAVLSTLDGSRAEVPSFIVAPVTSEGETGGVMNQDAEVECNIAGEDFHHGWIEFMKKH